MPFYQSLMGKILNVLRLGKRVSPIPEPTNSNLARIEELTTQLPEYRRKRSAQLSSALAKSQEYVRVLDEVIHILATVPDDEMYADVLELVLKATDSRFGIFGYISAEGDWFCPSMTRDIFAQCEMADKTIKFPKKQWTAMPTWGQVNRTHKTALINAPLPSPEGHIDILRIMIVPLVYVDALVGMIALANKPKDYTDDDRRTLESVAAQLSPVLSARLTLERRRDNGE